MEAVIELNQFRVYGLTDEPLHVSNVGDDMVLIAAPEETIRNKLGEIVGMEVPVSLTDNEGETVLPGRITAAEEGGCAGETELVMVFDTVEEATEPLAEMRERFAARYAFHSGVEHKAPRNNTAKPVMDEVLNDIARRETGKTVRLNEGDAADGRSVARALAEQMGLKYTDLEASGVDVLKVRDFRREFLLKHLFIPLYENAGYCKIAVVWELAPEAVAAIERTYGEKVSYSVAPEEQLVSAIEHAFNISENRRRAARMGVALRVRLGLYDTSWNLTAGPVQGVTRNLSGSGILTASPPLQKDPYSSVGARIGVLLFLPEYERPLRAMGRVVRASWLSKDPPVHLYAVEINHISEDDRRKLDVFRYTLMWGPHRLRVD